MASCENCDNLKQNAPKFLQRGITGEECRSLQDNTGLNPDLQPQRNNYQDLVDMNECLLGGLLAQLDAYDICDWETFARSLTNNMMIMFQAIICSEAGLWNNLIDSGALLKIINSLTANGSWSGGLSGGFTSGHGVASGNINIFSKGTDTQNYIRTNGNQTEGDLSFNTTT